MELLWRTGIPCIHYSQSLWLKHTGKKGLRWKGPEYSFNNLFLPSIINSCSALQLCPYLAAPQRFLRHYLVLVACLSYLKHRGSSATVQQQNWKTTRMVGRFRLSRPAVAGWISSSVHWDRLEAAYFNLSLHFTLTPFINRSINAVNPSWQTFIGRIMSSAFCRDLPLTRTLQGTGQQKFNTKKNWRILTASVETAGFLIYLLWYVRHIQQEIDFKLQI